MHNKAYFYNIPVLKIAGLLQQKIATTYYVICIFLWENGQQIINMEILMSFEALKLGFSNKSFSAESVI